MLVDLSGPSLLLAPGDEFDFPQEEAVRLIAAGFAAPVADTKIELAVRSPAPETRDARSIVLGLPGGQKKGRHR